MKFEFIYHKTQRDRDAKDSKKNPVGAAPFYHESKVEIKISVLYQVKQMVSSHSAFPGVLGILAVNKQLRFKPNRVDQIQL
ncbi:hypothetical protein ACMYR3_02625 [Ampullimonas aquatilis]|uniref:hypothetical protein n=1 Tax=Ampullimonas aquatilis TaxID=1341549 RepID=UPI003C730422